MPLILSVVAAFALAAFSLSGCSAADAGRTPFDGARAYADLETVVGIGPRFSGSEGAASTVALIESRLSGTGLNLDKYGFTAYTPLGRRAMTNVVAVSQGTRPGAIILSGHYDTKYLPYIEFVGANDSGSSTAFLIELARAIGPSRDGYSIWFVWFDGEEAIVEWTETDSLYGSREMVRWLGEQDRLSEVKAIINVDMIGDCQLNIIRDRDAPPWLLDAIWDTSVVSGVSGNFSWVEKAVQDDHLPFRRAGIPAINLIDFEYGANTFEHEQNWHTERDTLDRVCADSLQIVGDVLYRALPAIEEHLVKAEGDASDAR